MERYKTPILSFFSHIWATHRWNHSSFCFSPGWLTLRQTFRNILFIPCNICTVFPLLLLLFSVLQYVFFSFFHLSFPSRARLSSILRELMWLLENWTRTRDSGVPPVDSTSLKPRSRGGALIRNYLMSSRQAGDWNCPDNDDMKILFTTPIYCSSQELRLFYVLQLIHSSHWPSFIY